MKGINSTTVVLQHENRLIREMLAGHLEREPGIVLAGTAAAGPDLIKLVELRRPAVVVYEADTPRWSNEGLVTTLRRTGRELRMIGVHDALPASYVISAYDAGVSALVSYTSGLHALLDAVKNPLLPVEAVRANQGNGSALTDRERQVLYLISAGYPAKQVATELGISLRTVENHKQRIVAALDHHGANGTARLGPPSRAMVPRPREEPRLPQRPKQVAVQLRDPGGRLTGRLGAVLAAYRITVLTDEDLDEPDGEPRPVVTVLVDPAEHDWPAPDTGGGDSVVVVTSREPKRPDVTRALSGGVATVPAARMDDLLVPAIRAAAQGYVLINAGYLRGLAGPPPNGANGGWHHWGLALTPRECEILASIGRGHATKQTALQLGISIRTVENLQSNLFRKLRVHSRADALVAAHNLGLLDE